MASFGTLASEDLSQVIYVQKLGTGCETSRQKKDGEEGPKAGDCGPIGLPLTDLTDSKGYCDCSGGRTILDGEICRVVAYRYGGTIHEMCHSNRFIYVKSAGELADGVCGQPAKLPDGSVNPDAVYMVKIGHGIHVPFAEINWGPDLLADKGVSGGIELKNVSYNPRTHKACVTIKIKAKIEVFGGKVDFEEELTQCIELDAPCYEFWSNSWASAKICYKHPWQLCVKLKVGKYGIEKEWEKCKDIPRPMHACDPEPTAVTHTHAIDPAAEPCGCE